MIMELHTNTHKNAKGLRSERNRRKNAIDLLKSDHEKVRELLKTLENTSARAIKQRTQLLEEIETELMIHTKIEEEIFYPAFKAANEDEHGKIYYEAFEEHRAVEKLVLPDLKKTDAGSDQFSGRAKVLKELIEHHADEEEKEMFKLAKKTMDREELLELGQQMAERKEELKSSL